jgi:hypothetical protein
MNDQLRLILLDKCFDLGLPVSSKDDINTLKMYLDVDSHLDLEIINFPKENNIKRKTGIKYLFLKMFSN